MYFIIIGNYLTYIIGALLIVCGLMPFFPRIASKILKKEIKSEKKQKLAGILLIFMGIGLLVVGYMGWLF